MKKWILGGLGLAVVLFAGYMWSRHDGKAASAGEATVAKVERGDIESTVSTTGRVVPNLEVEIKCKASGKVINLPFEVSDPVKKGDLLVELDPVDESRLVKQSQVAVDTSQSRLNQAKENLEVAEQNLDISRKRAQLNLNALESHASDAKSDLDRAKRSLDEGYISTQEFEKARTASVAAQSDLETGRTQLDQLKTEEKSLELRRQDVELAKKQVELDKLRLQDAEQRLADTRVMAPIDGIVASRLVQTGMIISSGISTVGGGTTVMTLADLSRVFVLAAVDESDIGRVKEGQKAQITVDAFPTQPFTGEIVRIATKGMNAYNVVTFEVKIEILDEKKTMLKPEMTANVEILLDKRDNVLVVPVEAVTRKGEKHTATVVKADGSLEQREVKIGITDGINYEVLGGLSEGESVQVRSDVVETKWSGDANSKDNASENGNGQAKAERSPQRPPSVPRINTGAKSGGSKGL
jgi:multidrug efflux pump subunit AcrA (membrane-fusion protein)